MTQTHETDLSGSTSWKAGTSGSARPSTAAEFDQMMRQRATESRDVVLRSGLAAPLNRPRHLVFTARHGQVVWSDLAEDADATRIRPARGVIDLLEMNDPVPERADVTRPRPVLFADDATVRRVIIGFRQAANRPGADKARYLSAANRLALVSSMKFSVLRPLLTSVLAHRFYLGSGFNPHRWRDWAAAWADTAKITRSASQIQLLHLLCTLAFDRGGDGEVPAGLRNSLLAQESSVWVRGSSSKATATHSAYRSMTAFESTWNEVTLCDPALLDRHTLSGDVAAGTVTQVLGRTRVSLTNTPRFNESALWAVIDGHRHKVARHTMLAEDDTTLTMVLDVPQRAQAPMEQARQDRLPVVLYPQRFTMPAATPRTDNPWLTHPETPWTPREVPADVLIAGLPE